MERKKWYDATQVSTVRNFNKIEKSISIKTIYTFIKTGTYKITIDKIRELYKAGLTQEADNLKKRLPAFTSSGIFNSTRRNDALEKYYGLVMLDIDDIPLENINDVKQKAISIPFTLLCFISPSGAGLKILVNVDSSQEFHKEAYKHVAEYYHSVLKTVIDKSTSDIARQHYFSYDKGVFLNETHTFFHVSLNTKTDHIVSIGDETKGYSHIFERAVRSIEKNITFRKGQRNIFIHRLACNCNRFGIPKNILIALCLKQYEESGFTKDEIHLTIANVYEKQIEEFARIDNPFQEKTIPFSQNYDNPFLPDSAIKHLPKVIMTIASKYSDKRERDVFITGMLVSFSGSLREVIGTYNKKVCRPNLFGFIVAPAASGKGVMNDARDCFVALGEKIENVSRQTLKEYKRKIAMIKKEKRDTSDIPDKPPFKTLFIPANATTSAIYQSLEDSDGMGLIVDTEADILGKMMMDKIGDTPSLLRCAFHNEHVSYKRVTNDKHVIIKNPRLAVLLSGTPKQVSGIVNTVENGLFSRFIFYAFYKEPKWNDVSPYGANKNFPQIISETAEQILQMYEHVFNQKLIVTLSQEQWQELNTHFKEKLKKMVFFYSEETSSMVFRFGLITFKIIMILTALRKYEHNKTENKLQCHSDDFSTAVQLTDTYLNHSLSIFQSLPAKSPINMSNKKMESMYDFLPEDIEFGRADAIEFAQEEGLKVSEKTIWNYLDRLVRSGYLDKCSHNRYIKRKK